MRRYVWVVCLWLGCREPVEPPPAAPSSLLALTPELPGANCPNGGTAITSGLDDNNDGILQAQEIDSTAFVCNGVNGQDSGGLFGPVLKGSFTIQNELDLAAMAGVQTVTGDLRLGNTPGIDTISLPNLQEIQGNLTGGGGSATLDLPALISIGEGWSSFSQDLQSISAPALLSVGGTVEFHCSSLQTIELPALQTVGARLEIDGDMLQDLAFVSLQSVGNDLIIGQLALLRSLDLPALQTVLGRVLINLNPLLPTCQAQAIVDQLTNAPVSINITGDDVAGVCP